ncbi:MAG: thiamine phosphate synthase, partial [Fusobacterium sp.]
LKAYNDMNVDYIGVGPIFPTTTKDTAPVGLEYLEFAVANLHLPFIAIGGIKEHNIDEIISRGAERVCLVSDVVGAEDICKKVVDLSNKFKR